MYNYPLSRLLERGWVSGEQVKNREELMFFSVRVGYFLSSFTLKLYYDYLADVNTYLAASEAGSTVASWNTIGNTSVMF